MYKKRIDEECLVINDRFYTINTGIAVYKSMGYKEPSILMNNPSILEKWNEIDGINPELYTMSKSTDPDILTMCHNLLNDQKIEHTLNCNYWDSNTPTSITIYNNLDQPPL